MSDFIAACEGSSLNPEGGMLLRKRSSSALSLGHFGIGDAFAGALTASLRAAGEPRLGETIRFLDVSDCRLSDKALARRPSFEESPPFLLLLAIARSPYTISCAAQELKATEQSLVWGTFRPPYLWCWPILEILRRRLSLLFLPY